MTNKLNNKNDGQHYADLEMIRTSPEFQSAFFSDNDYSNKEIDYVRVDGGSDENPSYRETKFMLMCGLWCQPTGYHFATATENTNPRDIMDN